MKPLTPDQIMVKAMIKIAPHVMLSYCLTGQHYGVTFFRETRCPICR